MDGNTVLGTVNVMQQTSTSSTASLSVMLKAGTAGPSAQYNGDGTYPARSTPVARNTACAKARRWCPGRLRPQASPYGTALSAQQLDAVAQIGASTIPGAFTYAPAAGAVLGAGAQTLQVSFVPADIVDYNSPIGGSANITVTKVNPVITWNTPAAITAGTPTEQHAAECNRHGRPTTRACPECFTYSPPAGTVLPTGTTTLNVAFMPTDQTDYNSMTASVQQVVNSASTSVALSGSPNPSTFGQSVLFTAMVTSTATSAPVAGTVMFYDGREQVSAPRPSITARPSSARRRCELAPTPITAQYTGNNTFTGNTSQILQTVNQAALTLNWATPGADCLRHGVKQPAAERASD